MSSETPLRCPHCEWLGIAENAIVELTAIRCPHCLAIVLVNEPDDPAIVEAHAR